MTTLRNIFNQYKGVILAALILLVSACSDSSTKAISDEEYELLKEQTYTCWQKEVLDPVYDIIGGTVMKMYDQLSAGALNLMMMAFAVWLAMRLMKFVSSVTEDSPGQIWNEILQKAFICLFCGYLASSSGMLLWVINFLLFPIYTAFLEFGSEILALSSSDVATVKVMGSEITFEQPNVMCKMTEGLEATTEGFPPAIQDMMGCMVCAVADRLRLGRDVAYEVMWLGGVLPFVLGCLIWLIFIVVSCGFVFYLVDSIFRFGMMILLLPILIMSYAFKPTRKWTGIGFSNIMTSAAFMMAFSIIVATVLMAMVSLINDHQEIFNPEDPKFHLMNFSIALMCLLLIAFLIFGSMGVSQQLTSAIIGGKVEARFQQNLKAVGQALLGVLTGGLKYIVEKAALQENTRIGRAMKSAGALQNKLNEWAGRK